MITKVKKISRFGQCLFAVLLIAVISQLTVSANETYESRINRLSNSNKYYIAAGKILNKPDANTDDELRKIIGFLNKAIESEPSKFDKSIIETKLAGIYLIGLKECDKAKEHSSTALALDPESIHALEIDISSDMCVANIKMNYELVIGRLNKLVEEGRYFNSLYSLLGTAYMIKGSRTNTQSDIIMAKEMFRKAQEKGEPEASPNAFDYIIDELDQRIKNE